MMTGLLRAEWIKLRHLRITWLTPILPAALLMIGGILTIRSVVESIQTYGTPSTIPSSSRSPFHSPC